MFDYLRECPQSVRHIRIREIEEMGPGAEAARCTIEGAMSEASVLTAVPAGSRLVHRRA